MIPQTVSVRIPPSAGHMALLRTAIGGFAARENFTLEQVDDLRMAVEEAAVQVLRKAGESPLTLDVTASETCMEARISATIANSAPILDPESFSWMILSALADEVRSEHDGTRGVIVLTKLRTINGRSDEA